MNQKILLVNHYLMFKDDFIWYWIKRPLVQVTWPLLYIPVLSKWYCSLFVHLNWLMSIICMDSSFVSQMLHNLYCTCTCIYESMVKIFQFYNFRLFEEIRTRCYWQTWCSKYVLLLLYYHRNGLILHQLSLLVTRILIYLIMEYEKCLIIDLTWFWDRNIGILQDVSYIYCIFLKN